MEKLIEDFNTFLKKKKSGGISSSECVSYLSNAIRQDASIEAQSTYQSLVSLAKDIDALSDPTNDTSPITYSKYTMGAFKALVDQISKDMNGSAAGQVNIDTQKGNSRGPVQTNKY